MSWEDINNGAKEKIETGFENAFAKIETGANVMRIVEEEPYSRWVHWIPQANGGKGLSINCPGKGCPVCKDIAEHRKNKSKSKYSARKSHAINVLVKKNGITELKILDKGNGVFGKLKVLKDNVGDLRTYDINIIMTGKDFNEIEYNILPVFPQAELTASEKALCEKLFNLEEAFPMLTLDEVNMVLAGQGYDEVFKLRNEGNVATENIEDSMPNVDFNRPIG